MLNVFMIVCCLFLIEISCKEAPIDDRVLIKFYKILGCSKVQDVDRNRPMRFNCPDYSNYSWNRCYFRGRDHIVGELMANDILPKCVSSCTCEQFAHHALFTREHIICPDLFHNKVDLSCVLQYDSLYDCCSARQICDPSIISQMARCVVDGMEYYHGERIFPDSDRCYKCLCGPGFNNQTSFAQNPYCMEMECNIELYQWDEIKTGCVPVYNKLTTPCCPYELKCPGYTDVIVQSSTTPYTNDERYSCKFGDLTLRHGQKLRSDDKCLECKCSTPPYITCMKIHKC